MAAAEVRGVQLVVTIEVRPTIDEQGLLHLPVAKLKVGVMNITPVAKLIARRMYRQQIESGLVDLQDWRVKIAGALLNDRPFDPVFTAEDKKVRVEKMTVSDDKLVIRFVPVR